MSDEDSRIFTLLDKALNEPNSFLPESKYAAQLVADCYKLISQDNLCIKLSNSSSSLCSSYPPELIIPLSQICNDDDPDTGPLSSTIKELKDLLQKGRFARTRGRFPIPAILVGNKFVCRSSTLAHSAEIYTRQGIEYFIKGESSEETEVLSNNDELLSRCDSDLAEQRKTISNNHENSNIAVSYSKSSKRQHKLNFSVIQDRSEGEEKSEWLLTKMRKTDIDILHKLKVNVICDLMVEKKKVKYGLTVTSSEKVDRENRYSNFQLICMPYPGCEFFAEYSQNRYESSGLKFNWKQGFIDAKLQIPRTISKMSNIDWKQYMDWDIVTLTLNYLKLLLHSLVSPTSSGILLHCISGWDRTPLYVSLIRLSLWADGLIHQSLDAEEMVFLTLAYDWLLFSHQFQTRISNCEEIMHFCFNFLDYISPDEYSLLPLLESNQGLNLFYDNFNSNPVLEENSSTVTSEVEASEITNGGCKRLLESNLSDTSTDKSFESRDVHRNIHFQSLSLNNLDSYLNKNGSLDNGASGNGSESRVCDNSNVKAASSDTSAFPTISSPDSRNMFTSSASSTLTGSASVFCTGNDNIPMATSPILNIKLDKRREKLKMARSEMIPNYCAVLQKHKRNPPSSLSAIMVGGLESLVNYVKSSSS